MTTRIKRPATRCAALVLALFGFHFLPGNAATPGLPPPAEPGKQLVSNDGIFRRPSVVSFEIEIPAASAAALSERPRDYVRAKVSEGGRTWSEVGIHLKGRHGSFQKLNAKPSLTLKFDKFTDGQQFHGLKKIHLNNAAQDPSYCCEIVCGELFREAGVPAARGALAAVKLNGRPLGLFVLKEGFDKEFLDRYFHTRKGSLYDTGYRLEINQTLERIVGDDSDLAVLGSAAAAAAAPVPERFEALKAFVDLDLFLTFMAMEVITVHWDGYSMFKNNYRLYVSPETHRLVFIPHGMDMMFQVPECPILPGWDGIIARGLMDTPQGKQLYLNRVKTLSTTAFSVEKLTRRIRELQAIARPAFSGDAYRLAAGHNAAVEQLIRNIARRRESLVRQAANPDAFATGRHPLFRDMGRRGR